MVTQLHSRTVNRLCIVIYTSYVFHSFNFTFCTEGTTYYTSFFFFLFRHDHRSRYLSHFNKFGTGAQDQVADDLDLLCLQQFVRDVVRQCLDPCSALCLFFYERANYQQQTNLLVQRHLCCLHFLAPALPSPPRCYHFVVYSNSLLRNRPS